jgi:O-glycosyl hydrolase
LLWATKIHDAIVNAKASAYLYWIGVQGGPTNSKLIRISDDKQSILPSKRLWVFANWSRFVRPSAIRVATTGVGNGDRVSAYRNEDGTVVAQIVRTGGSGNTMTVGIQGETVSVAEAWITDNSHACEQMDIVVNANGLASVQIPGRSMVTLILR